MNFLLYLFIVCCIYQIAYQLVLIFAIIKYKPSQNLKSTHLKSVSVIVCAKNEAANLQKNLPFILEQNYPNFEVIVVDDGSDEQLTMNPETSSGQANARLTTITLTKEEKIGSGKKYALQKGVEAAKNELILLTDADCKPVSKNWIAEMAACINDRHKIVLGISPYKHENTFLNSLIEYETAQTAMQYIGFALSGNPYMSVGRNVLYDAVLLKSKKWANAELSIASGDDDLAIQTLATKINTTVCLSKDSYTISDAKDSWSAWFKQKLRHYESGRLYKLSHRLLLGSYLLMKTVFYVCFLLLFILKFYVLFLVILIAFIITTMIINFYMDKMTNLNKRWQFSFLNDSMYCIFTVGLGLLSQLKPSQNWK